jgi:hypothetical protein
MHCKGICKSGEFINTDLLIEYEDVFGKTRETSISYAVFDDTQIYRQEALDERNTNT